MTHTIEELLIFMEKLRENFPSKDILNKEVRCTSGQIMKRFNMSSDEVWKYISECADYYLLDNNGGKLRFNDSILEDLNEMIIIYTLVAKVEELGSMPGNVITVGFLERVFSGIYRDGCPCAGKYGEMSGNHYVDKEQPKRVINEIGNCLLKKAKEVPA